MKIESSEVEIKSQVKSSYEMTSQSQFEFRHEVLGYMDVNEDMEKYETDGYENVSEATNETTNCEDCLEPYQKVSMMLLELILQNFLGGDKQVKMFSLDDIKSQNSYENDYSNNESKKMLVKNSVNIEKSYEYSRSDSISFSTQATIKTSDKDIELNLDLSYTKEFYEKHSETLKFEEMHFLDPLVIQYSGESTAFDSLSESMSFNFDINSDGTSKELPLLKDGNGFLVLDKNSNGSIDDGSELFGPASNDGFGELSEYDSDGNNWIDENDAIFEDLQIWSKNEKGEDSLIALGQSGIGALYLGDAQAGMAYNKSVNESMAYLKSNSIFLREDGSAGIISSMDFLS
jgi:hypothetical protein